MIEAHKDIIGDWSQMPKMKTYVIMVSRIFPKYHPRAGQYTGFAEKILSGDKKHTIRANFDYWEKAITEIMNGIACLSVRDWTGTPYRSEQKEITRLSYYDAISVQPLDFIEVIMTPQSVLWKKDRKGFDRIYQSAVSDLKIIAANDGLSWEDFQAWFHPYDLSKRMAIISFKCIPDYQPNN